MLLVVTLLSQQLLVLLLPHLLSTHRHFDVVGVLHLLLALGGNRSTIRIQQLGCDGKTLFISISPFVNITPNLHAGDLPPFFAWHPLFQHGYSLFHSPFHLLSTTTRGVLHSDLGLQDLWNEIVRDILQMGLRADNTLGDSVLKHLQFLRVVLEVHFQLIAVEGFTTKFHHTSILDKLLVNTTLDIIHTR